jgi:SAM-dependent methyltransferase
MTWATPERRTRLTWELFLVSFLALYLELVVIRWLASEIRVFAYFKNLPLMAGFLGLGLGCARWRSRGRLFPWFPLLFGLLCLLPAYAEPLDLVRLRFPDLSVFLWSAEAALPLLQAVKFVGIILGIFFLTVAVFTALGEKIGELFDAFPPLTAYSINVAASLLGILAFSAIAFARWPPLLWVAVAAVLSLWFFHRVLSVTALAVTVALVAWAPGATHWSPYYRIDFSPLIIGAPVQAGHGVQVGYSLDVNRDFHQRALNLSEEFRRQHPMISRHPMYRHADLVYNLPFRLAAAQERVLVVGAGTGNDVAAALRNGARRVDAVEIDPAILDLGRRHHPEGPYGADGVRVINNDARAFFRQTDGRYDLIIFGFLDSHTMFSSLSSLRLDNYVYTVESLREAIGHLTPRGILTLSFTTDAGEWIGQRLYNTLHEAWGQEPVALHNGRDSGVTFVAGPGLERQAVGRLAGLFSWRPRFPGRDRIWPATDDWPFLYLNPRGRPVAYVLVLGLILLASWLLIRGSFHARDVAFDWHMFFLGAAFMLVEVKSIAELSLLFGSTWLVNSAVFSGILLMILGANAVVARRAAGQPVRRVPTGVPWVPGSFGAGIYAWLGLSLLLPYLTGLAWLNAWPFVWRAAMGALATSLPIFFAGIIFATSFKGTKDASGALAANMFGALIGGILEYSSMALGIRSLSLVALVLYSLSWLTLAFRGWRLAWEPA